MKRNILTPSELNREARLHLEAGFGRVWVEGEVSNLARPASGHRYFSLKDERAQLRCALFRGNARNLAVPLENGQQVQALGRLSLYEPRGDYQLIVERVEPAGEGPLRAAFEALRRQLESEGLFETGRKRPLPDWPLRIGVITSPSGAVIRDILNVLRRRWPLGAVRLYPVPVQGDDAPPAIVRALEAANEQAWAQVLVVGRGGGSLEDLWAFNTEAVARAVAGSALPVISAVGHETDHSISDYVADLRAPTPSAAAELLAPDVREIHQRLRRALLTLDRHWHHHQQRRSQSLDHLAHRLAQQDPGRQLDRHRQTLEGLEARLRVAAQRQPDALGERLAPLVARLRRQASDILPERKHQLARRRERLRRWSADAIPRRRQVLQSLARTLHGVSPLPTLERGYAVVTDRDSGATLDSVALAQPGQDVDIRLVDGSLAARVASVDSSPLLETDPTDTD